MYTYWFNLYKLGCIITLLVILSSCSWNKIIVDSSPPKYKETINCIKTIKYRDSGAIDVCNQAFEKLISMGNVSVFGAWYDRKNEYMIIQLKKTNYQYCWLKEQDWIAFQNASDIDEYYPVHIKWKFDCRNWHIPQY